MHVSNSNILCIYGNNVDLAAVFYSINCIYVERGKRENGLREKCPLSMARARLSKAIAVC
jgi:hypothetical protein